MTTFDLIAQTTAVAPTTLASLLAPDDWRLVLALVLGLYGLIVGSFLNVCIYRVPAGLSIVSPRSYCYTCGSMVRAVDNIPVVSYILLGGCCRHCGSPYGSRYMFIELLTGLLFAAIGWQFGAIGPSGALLAYTVFAGFMVVATFTDIDHFIIPDGVSYGSGAAGVLLAGIVALEPLDIPSGLIPPIAVGWPFAHVGVLGRGDWLGAMANAAVGGVFAATMLYLVGFIGKLVFRKEAMGMGDVKLMIGIGAFLGVVHTVVAFFVACIIGASVSVSWILTQRLFGRRSGPLRESYAGTLGEVARARTAELERLHGDPLDLASTDGAEKDEMERRPEAAWSLAALGRLLGRNAAGPHPYVFKHLPFGPYLAIGALLVLFAHTRVQQEANWILSTLGLHEPSAANTRIWTSSNPTP